MSKNDFDTLDPRREVHPDRLHTSCPFVHPYTQTNGMATRGAPKKTPALKVHDGMVHMANGSLQPFRSRQETSAPPDASSETPLDKESNRKVYPDTASSWGMKGAARTSIPSPSHITGKQHQPENARAVLGSAVLSGSNKLPDAPTEN